MNIYSKYAVAVMKKLRIKTSCGIQKYNKLKTNKTVLGKFRFYFNTSQRKVDFDHKIYPRRQSQLAQWRVYLQIGEPSRCPRRTIGLPNHPKQNNHYATLLPDQKYVPQS